MKLISDVDYERLTKPQLPLSSGEALFHDKSDAATKLLEINSIADDIKLVLYNTLVRGINEKLTELVSKPVPVITSAMNMKETEVETPGEKTIKVSEYEELRDNRLVDILPKSFQAAALLILKLLRKHESDIGWSATGEVNFNTVRCVGSNIIDLLSFVLRPQLKYRGALPAGANRFLYLLRKLSIPTVILGIHLRQTMNETSTETLKRRRTMKRPLTPVGSSSEEEMQHKDSDQFSSEEIEDHSSHEPAQSSGRTIWARITGKDT